MKSKDVKWGRSAVQDKEEEQKEKEEDTGKKQVTKASVFEIMPDQVGIRVSASRGSI